MGPESVVPSKAGNEDIESGSASNPGCEQRAWFADGWGMDAFRGGGSHGGGKWTQSDKAAESQGRPPGGGVLSFLETDSSEDEGVQSKGKRTTEIIENRQDLGATRLGLPVQGSCSACAPLPASECPAAHPANLAGCTDQARATLVSATAGRGTTAARAARDDHCEETIFEFVNVTSWSQWASDYCAKSSAHILAVAEHHQPGHRLDEAMRQMHQAGWRPMWSPACRSSSGGSGTYGGTAVNIRAHLQGQPLSRATPRSWGYHDHDCAFCSAGQVSWNRREVITLCGYFRNGSQSEEAVQIWEHWLHDVGNGENLFIAAADFNDPPDIVQRLPWVSRMRGVVVAPSEATCSTGSTLDYFIIHEELLACLVGVEVNWVVPFGPHCSVRATFRHSLGNMSKEIIVKPKCLPDLPEDIAPDRVSELWEVASKQAAGHVQAALLIQQRERMVRQRSDTEPIELSAVCQELLLPDELASAQGIKQKSELASSLGGQISCSYWQWCNACERFVLMCAQIPEKEWEPYFGRGAPPQVKTVLVGHSRRGPLPGVKVSCDLPLAGRVAQTFLKVAQHLLKAPRSLAWQKAMQQLLCEDMKEVDIWQQALGPVVSAKVLVDCSKLLQWARRGGNDRIPVQCVVQKLDAAVKKLSRAQTNDMKEKKQQWAEAALQDGAKRAHRWTNIPNSVPKRQILTSDGQISVRAAAKDQTLTWGQKWKSYDAKAVAEFQDVVRQVRAKVLEWRHAHQDIHEVEKATWREKFGPQSIRKTAKGFKKETGIGIDHLDFQLVSVLPDSVLEGLTDMFIKVLETMVLPEWNALTILHLIGKKISNNRLVSQATTVWQLSDEQCQKEVQSFRTVGTMCSFLRLLLGILSQDGKRWDTEIALPGDTAAAGCNAQLSVIRRHAFFEAKVKLGQKTGQLLWDISGFYENLQPRQVADDLQDLQFPRDYGALALASHSCPRILALDGAVGDQLRIGQSIITGCPSSPSIARATTHGPARRVLERFPNSMIFNHVDDFAQEFSSPSYTALTEDVKADGSCLVEALSEKKQEISDKSIFVCPDKSAGLAVQSFFAAYHGVKVVWQPFGKDLGVDVGVGVRRVIKVQAKRQQKARRRLARTAYLARFSRKAAKLIKPGSLPQASYGSCSMGMAESHRRALDAHVARATGSSGWAACPVSVCQLRLGFIPSARQQADQVRTWILIWNSTEGSPKDRELLTEAWKVTRDELQTTEKQKRWQRVTGAIGATIATLLELGWEPLRPNLWMAHRWRTEAEPEPGASLGDSHGETGGERWLASLGQGAAKDAGILEFAEQSAAEYQWRQCTHRHGGEGLDQGCPSFDGVSDAIRTFKKNSRFAEAAGLEKAAAGGAACGNRMLPQQRCQRCGAAIEDAWHRYYECPDNDAPWQDEFQSEWLQKTSWLKSFAAKCRAKKPSCLWLRGILPYNSAGRLAERYEDLPTKTITWASNRCGGGSLYTDGSGGSSRHIPKALRRVGAGAVSFQTETIEGKPAGLQQNNFALTASSVPGKQTVPRAELFAAIAGVEGQCWQTDDQSFSAWTVDAKYVSEGWARKDTTRKSSFGRSFGAGANTDLWQAIEAPGVEARLPAPKWVKSHCTLEDVCAGKLSFEDYFGNGMADVAAGVAADFVAVPDQIAKVATRELRIAFLVAIRIGIIEARVAHHMHHERCVFQVRPMAPAPSTKQLALQLSERVAQAGHSLHKFGAKHLRCHLCGQVKLCSQWKWWQDNVCHRAKPPPSFTETQLPNEPAIRDEQFVGTLSQLQKRRKAVAAASKQEKYVGIRRGMKARDAWQRSMTPGSSSSDQSAGPEPVWVDTLHTSHVLSYAAGAVWCQRCGATARRQPQQGPLLQSCRRCIPDGSKWRLRKLSEGVCTCWPEWPDGRSRAVRVQVTRVRRTSGTGATAKVAETHNCTTTQASNAAIPCQARIARRPGECIHGKSVPATAAKAVETALVQAVRQLAVQPSLPDDFEDIRSSILQAAGGPGIADAAVAVALASDAWSDEVDWTAENSVHCDICFALEVALADWCAAWRLQADRSEACQLSTNGSSCSSDSSRKDGHRQPGGVTVSAGAPGSEHAAHSHVKQDKHHLPPQEPRAGAWTSCQPTEAQIATDASGREAAEALADLQELEACGMQVIFGAAVSVSGAAASGAEAVPSSRGLSAGAGAAGVLTKLSPITPPAKAESEAPDGSSHEAAQALSDLLDLEAIGLRVRLP